MVSFNLTRFIAIEYKRPEVGFTFFPSRPDESQVPLLIINILYLYGKSSLTSLKVKLNILIILLLLCRGYIRKFNLEKLYLT